MAIVSDVGEGFVVLPEIVCMAISEPGEVAAPGTRPVELRMLTSNELIELVESRNGYLSSADLLIIMSIAQERLDVSKADANLAGQLLQACRKDGNGDEKSSAFG